MLRELHIVQTQYLYQITAAGDRETVNALYDWIEASEIRTWHADEVLDLAGSPKPIQLRRIDNAGVMNANSIYHRRFQVRQPDMLLIKLKWTPSR